MSVKFDVCYDGASRPMIQTPTGRLLSISEFRDGRWVSYEREDEDCQLIVRALNGLAIKDSDLPQWSDCEAAVDEKRATALQQFIYDYEPSEDYQWRRQLAAVVQEAKGE